MAQVEAATIEGERREERLFLSTFALGHFANDWTAGCILLLTPAIAVSMGLGAAEIGLLLTLMGIGGGLAYLPAGLAADYTRSRGMLLLLTFWWVAIGYFVASLAPDYWWLVVLLAVAIMGDAAWHPIATGVLTQKMPDRKAHALGIHAMGGTIGAEAVAPLAVGFLLVWFDWRTVLQISVLPAVIMGVLFIPMVKRIGPSPDHRFDMADFGARLGPGRTQATAGDGAWACGCGGSRGLIPRGVCAVFDLSDDRDGAADRDSLGGAGGGGGCVRRARIHHPRYGVHYDGWHRRVWSSDCRYRGQPGFELRLSNGRSSCGGRECHCFGAAFSPLKSVSRDLQIPVT